MIRISVIALLILLAPVCRSAAAQTGGSAPAGQPSEAQKEAWAKDWDNHIRNDWGFLDRYRAADAALPRTDKEPRIVFLGDSITQGWTDKMPSFFGSGRIGRGISGQTTPQMLVRFRQDVVDLHPAVVHIMAATNDIASNTGPISTEETEAYFRDMVELAQAHGIRVILASVPPSAGFPWRPGLAVTGKIKALNTWLKRYAAETGSVYADYWAVLQDGNGGMKPGLSSDGVHPTEAGYALMQPITEHAIREALAKPQPTCAAPAP